MMAEAQAITTALGLTIPEQMMERRLNAAGSVVGHKIWHDAGDGADQL
jgi:2-dehydropantoate 2-reductase